MTTDKIPEPGQERMVTAEEKLLSLSPAVSAQLSEIATSRACIGRMLTTIMSELKIQEEACLKIDRIMSGGGE